MTPKDEQLMALTRTSMGAINAYCRVLELHLKAVSEGQSPIVAGKMGEMVAHSMEGLHREVSLLNSLRRGEVGALGLERDSTEAT